MSEWIKKWAKEQNSLLWDMPPKYYKMWNFILYNCKGGKYDGSLSDIAKGIEWTENGKKHPARSTVQTMLNWFINQKMIIASGDGQGRSLVVKNWEKYQGGKGAAPEMQKKVQKFSEMMLNGLSRHFIIKVLLVNSAKTPIGVLLLPV